MLLRNFGFSGWGANATHFLRLPANVACNAIGASLFDFTNQPLLPHPGPSLQTNLCDMEVLCSNKGFIALDETASLPKGTNWCLAASGL